MGSLESFDFLFQSGNLTPRCVCNAGRSCVKTTQLSTSKRRGPSWSSKEGCGDRGASEALSRRYSGITVLLRSLGDSVVLSIPTGLPAPGTVKPGTVIVLEPDQFKKLSIPASDIWIEKRASLHDTLSEPIHLVEPADHLFKRSAERPTLRSTKLHRGDAQSRWLRRRGPRP